MGESQNGALVPVSGLVAVDTFGGRIHVEWDPRTAVTPLGQLPFFTEYLKVRRDLGTVNSNHFPRIYWEQR